MKKIICLIMMAAMLFCSAFGIGSSATAEPGQDPDFELQPVALDASDPDYDPNISARELGIMRIQESGGSDFLDCFDDEFLELISTATSVIVTEAYFLEEGDSEEMELVAVSYEEFMNAESDDSVGEDIPVIVPGDNG